MFDEAGRLMRDHFWVADMAGVDWAAVLARYRPLVDAVGTHDDLVDLLWELHGELGTSHAYVSGAGGGGDWPGGPGLLGADLERADDGWRVVRVLPAETSAPAARCPLAGPGVAVRAGDVILAVDGRPVDPESGPAPLLVGTANRPVELTVRTGPRGGRRGAPGRRAPLSTRRRCATRTGWPGGGRTCAEPSGGRLGYLHVPDMVASGWAQLHRDLRRRWRATGLVVDVRGQQRRPHLAAGAGEAGPPGHRLGRARGTARRSTYPDDAPRGPMVAVADEYSGSDGDIVTAGDQAAGHRAGGRHPDLGRGDRHRRPVHAGRRHAVTQPRYAFWFDGSGWGVENHGVDPDVEVVITPQDRAAGRDPQLERAVDLALEALARAPGRPAPRPRPPARPAAARSSRRARVAAP